MQNTKWVINWAVYFALFSALETKINHHRPPNAIGNAFFVSHWTVKILNCVLSLSFFRRVMLSQSSDKCPIIGYAEHLSACKYYGREGKRETTTRSDDEDWHTFLAWSTAVWRLCNRIWRALRRRNERRSSAIHVSPSEAII